MRPFDLCGHRVACLLACAAMVAVTSSPGLAYGADWQAGGGRSRFVYRAEGKRLSDVLNDFASSQGMPAIVDPNVEGVVSGNFDSPAADFLQAISKAYSLIWYHDGTALYFYPAKAIQSRIYKLQGYDQSKVTKLLQSLHVRSGQQPLRYDPVTRTLMVYGAPRYIELVGLAVESLDIGAQDDNKKVVRVFPLRFATAADRTIGDTMVPGLVTMLRAIYGVGQSGDTGAAAVDSVAKVGMGGPTSASAGRALMAIAGIGSSAGSQPSKSIGPTRSSQWASQDGLLDERSGMTPDPRRVRSPVVTTESEDNEKPRFEADETSNAVVIYGYPSRMRDFAELIKTLDVQPVLVELEAMVIDVASESVSSLGVDWSVAGNRVRLGITSPQSDATNSGGTILPGNPFVMGTVIADAGRALIARVMALQGEGKARVVSKPKVLGVSNRASIMQEKRVASVRVAGVLEASLHQIEAGTLLHVVPQVTRSDQPGPTHIKMSLLIQDGSFETQQVDQLPVLKKTEIRTEAHVIEGESLLIGGITMESESAVNTGVPGISSLPLIGGLFRQRSSRKERTERLFLITPRVVEERPTVPTTALAAPSPPASAPVSTPVPAPLAQSAPPVTALPILAPAPPPMVNPAYSPVLPTAKTSPAVYSLPVNTPPLYNDNAPAQATTALQLPAAVNAYRPAARLTVPVPTVGPQDDEIDALARRIAKTRPYAAGIGIRKDVRKP